MISPVLLLIFNRPDTTAQVFGRIRAARPPRLYVAADGARAGRAQEAELCQQARAIIDQVDWPCEVHALFRDENLGCRRAIAGALDWFFKHEEYGVILEDDCLPEATFFDYCDSLLVKYKDDARVMCVSGDNFLEKLAPRAAGESYYFSVFAHIWGWATWRRAWAGYDSEMVGWSPAECRALLKKTFPGNAALRRNWFDLFESVANGHVDTWDYQWNYHCWKLGGLSCVPALNQISNIGFDDRATHTVNPESHLSKMITKPLPLPIAHPFRVSPDLKADEMEAELLFDQKRFTWRRYWGRRLKKLLGVHGYA